MAFAIPKIEYKNLDTIGDTTNGDDEISNIPDTTTIEVGMFVRGSGIPVGATVLSKTSSSVTISANATATASSVDVYFGFEINFQYPPKEPKSESTETNATKTESLSGKRQVSVNYIEKFRNLTFSFLSQSLYEDLQTFLDTHGLLGLTFRYFEDQTLSSYVEYELDTLKVESRKIAPKGEDQYVWETPLKFRRVV